MSRRKRLRDDLADVVVDAVISGARAATAPIDPAVRAAEEEARAVRLAQRRRERAQEQRVRFIALGFAFLVGGLALRVIHPLAAVGLAFISAAFAGRIAQWLMSPRAPVVRPEKPVPPRPEPPPVLDGAALSESRRELIAGVLRESNAEVGKIERAAEALPGGDDKALCRRVGAAAGQTCAAIARQPDKFHLAQRALTYHLPKAAYLAETMAELARSGGDAKRLADARHVLSRMEMFFEKTLIDLNGVDAQEMDLEMRLINQALDEDLDVKGRP